MTTKLGFNSILPQFKHHVEIKFKTKIKTLYLDNGGEFVSLKQYLYMHRISHYTPLPIHYNKIVSSNIVIIT